MVTTVSPRSKIPAESLIELYCLAMSLLARLKAVQTEVEVPLTDLSQLTLAELKTEVVTFGQKHQGETYETAWEDQGWINFMVSKYGTSKVPQPSPPDQVRGVDGGAPRKNEHPSACAAPTGIGARRLRPDRRAFWTQIHPSQGQGHEHSSIWGHRTHSTGPGRRTGVRDVQPGDYGHDSSPSGSGVHCTSGSYPEHGERSGPRDQAPGGPDREAVDVSDPESETVAESCLAMHQDVQELHQMIQKFTQELESVLSSSKPLGKPFMMGEVFCSDASPLTQQVLNMGHQAFRFGLAQGDLSTIGGRQKLFQMIASHRPKHLWYSPVCGPWSSWSALNASRSLESQWEYQQQRSDLRYQIALGVVLYRYQVSTGLHFSWEQPQKSLMLLHPGLNEIHQHTQVSQFDMCEAGALKDPVNNSI